MTASPSPERMERFLQRLHNDWFKPSGPCKGCLLRSRDVEPGCSGGDWGAKIAFVAISPNETSKRRKRGNHEVPDLQQYSFPSYDEFKSIRKGDRYWTSNGKSFPFDRELTAIVRRLDMGLEDIYYTNSQKCANEVKNPARDRQGRVRCLGHLQSEVRVLSPRLVVAFGRQPWGAVQETMKASRDYDDFPSGARLMPDGRTYLIGLYHWSNWGRNKGRIPTEKKYAEWASVEVAKAVKKAGL